jgi:hypothetical protein
MVLNDNAVKLHGVSRVSNKAARCHSAVILVQYFKLGFAKLPGIRKNIKEF